MLSAPETVFIFVAFVVVANLVSKQFAMKHERALKFGEAQKGSWPNQSLIIFLVAAVAPAFLFFWVSGGMPRLSTHETVFTFVAFVVVANLISKHFTMKHELALKQEKVKEAPVPPKYKRKKTGMSFGTKVGILLALSSLVPLAVILLWFTSYRPADIVHAEHNAPTAPHISFSPTPFPAPPNAMVESAQANEPESASSWTEDLPFDADQYPSITACAAPLARQIVRALEERIDGDESADASAAAASEAEKKITPTITKPIFIDGPGLSANDFTPFKDALKEAIRSENPTVTFAQHKNNGVHALLFKLQNLDPLTLELPGKSFHLREGEVACEWSFHEREQRFAPLDEIGAVSFKEKPWLVDFQKFTARYPNSRRYFIGATKQAEPLRSKAHGHAVQDIANRLNLTAEQIEPHIVDKFTQAIERPYGTVFREAILVYNPPTSAVPVVNRNYHDGPPTMQKPSFEFSLAMIVCLTVVAGFISNIATQGYYRTGISNSVVIGVAFLVALILLNVVLVIID